MNILIHSCRMKEVFIGIGIELGLLVGLPCLSVLNGWRVVFGVALLPVYIMLMGLVSPFLPLRQQVVHH